MTEETTNPSILYALKILDLIDKIQQVYDQNYKKIGEINNLQSDICHAIEFAPDLNVGRASQLCMELQNVRKERRNLKDQNDVAFGLREFLKSGPAQNFYIGLMTTISRAKAKEADLEGREYHARTAEGEQLFFKEEVG